jgi:AcrR family transcriptional regulator
VPVQEALRVSEDDPATERHARILDAAERCFVRSGFHRTTMQDIAAEAKMSPGNLYRYFQSKDALVAGITERDRAEIAGDFANLLVRTISSMASSN